MPLNAAASSLADSPSTMKLLDRLRWLPTEIPTPGTAEVSGKTCVPPPTLVSETPGTSNARSRKFRPFIGRFLTSAWDTVPAIWVRAASSTVPSPVTVTLVSIDPTGKDTVSSYRASDRHRQRAPGVGESLCPEGDLVRTDAQIREAESAVRVGHDRGDEIRIGLTGGDIGSNDDGPL